MTKEALNAEVTVRHKHARKCKKPFGDCGTCEANMQWFGRLDLETLSRALDDRTGSK